MAENFEYSRQQVQARMQTAENRIWRALLSAAPQSIFAWQPVVRELLGISLVWGAWLFIQMIGSMPDAGGLVTQFVMDKLPTLFWITVAISALSFLSASFKSALPAALTLVASVMLAIAEMYPWHLWALLAANIATVVFAIGFSFHGGRFAQHYQHNEGINQILEAGKELSHASRQLDAR